MTEIEIRGKLSPSNFTVLFNLLSHDGKPTDHYHRLSVDISSGFDPVTKTWKNSSGTDIRLKKSDNKEKLSIKTGDFKDKVRKEIEIKLVSGQFLSSLDFLESLGYTSGMVYFWESWEFDYLGVEVKLSKYTADYFTFEIEGKENKDVDSIAAKLQVAAYTDTEYRAAIDWENQTIHQLYSRKLVEKILKEKF